MLASSPGPLVAATVGPGQSLAASNDWSRMSLDCHNRSPDQIWLPPLVSKQEDNLWQGRTRYGSYIQMVQGTTYGSQNWSRTICGCHNWSPRTIGGCDQFACDRSMALVIYTVAFFPLMLLPCQPYISLLLYFTLFLIAKHEYLPMRSTNNYYNHGHSNNVVSSEGFPVLEDFCLVSL